MIPFLAPEGQRLNAHVYIPNKFFQRGSYILLIWDGYKKHGDIWSMWVYLVLSLTPDISTGDRAGRYLFFFLVTPVFPQSTQFGQSLTITHQRGTKNNCTKSFSFHSLSSRSTLVSTAFPSISPSWTSSRDQHCFHAMVGPPPRSRWAGGGNMAQWALESGTSGAGARFVRASTAMTRASRVLKPVVFLSLYFVCNFILFYFIFIFIRFGLVCFWFKVASGHFFGGYVGRQCRRGGRGGVGVNTTGVCIVTGITPRASALNMFFNSTWWRRMLTGSCRAWNCDRRLVGWRFIEVPSIYLVVY